MNTIQIRQHFDKQTSTYTYLLGDLSTRKAVILDPVLNAVERDLNLLSELKWSLEWILETHVHADHITGANLLRERTGAKSAASARAGIDCIDMPMQDAQCLEVGAIHIRALETPGHTSACMSYVLTQDGTDTDVFTGDALLIRGCGRTDFQGGSAPKLFESVRNKLFTLPGSCRVWPGHDYRGFTQSSIREEREHNPRLKMSNSLEDFVEIMKNLDLADPKFMGIALPANLFCGSPPVKTQE